MASPSVPHKFPQRIANSGEHNIPLFRRASPLHGRDDTTEVGLGDYMDITYNVLITVGGAVTPMVLDTGSSDIWVVSSACINKCSTDVPVYSQSTFQSTGLDARLLYGDSSTGTHAFGLIGKDIVGIAGFSLPDQLFAAINDTNTTVLETGAAGIFGLGFPISSVIRADVFDASTPVMKRQNTALHNILPSSNSYATRFFPHFPLIHSGSNSLLPRLDGHNLLSNYPSAVLDSYSSSGPLVSRLAILQILTAPMFTVTLQRDSVDLNGNAGILTLGALPYGVKNESLTWSDLRLYTAAQGGLAAPNESLNEIYPIAWEIFIDDVFLDGHKLPRSNLSPPDIALSALLDTGSSLIRGPSDVVEIIRTRIGGTRFACTTPHTLAFQIKGVLFPVDPRDFVNQFSDSITNCEANVVSTDPPALGGYLYSWSLGDPFLKSVLASFYYGNVTHPSRDPPRIGLLSTVPADADSKLKDAVSEAIENGGKFLVTSEVPHNPLTGIVSANLPEATKGFTPSMGTNTNYNGASQSTPSGWSNWTLMFTMAAMMLVRWF